MVYDPDIGKIVLFAVDELTRAPLGETWTYDGVTWTKESPSTSPPARWSTAMAYDPAMRKIVLYGGIGANDTWVYDGSTWIQQHPVTSPTAPGVMAYDDAIGKILFVAAPIGGGGAETWTFDGTTWAKASPAASPRGFDGYTMTYDAGLRKIVLFDSSNDEYLASKDVSDTWTYDGSNWTQQSLPTTPPARTGGSMAYDPRLSATVLFGGTAIRYRENDLLQDTWTYKGKTWTKQTPPTSPSTLGVLAYDPNLNSLVLFGMDVHGGPPAPPNDTWMYEPVQP